MAKWTGIKARTDWRAKDVDSFVKKIVVRKDYDDPWARTTDKAGARAVVDDAVALESLHAALEEHWSDRLASATENKSEELKPEQLGYMGLHLHVVAPSEHDDDEAIECEVQLRTAAQDVWSVVSHPLLYKAPTVVPKDTKRRMARLMALVELIDEEVHRAMARLLDDPAYPAGLLTQQAEQAFFMASSWKHNWQLSQMVLPVLVESIPADERIEYGQQLLAFVATHTATLKRIYQQYGNGSELSDDPRYALLTQPEALVLFERSTNAEQMLLAAVTDGGNDLRWLIDPVLAIWGKPLPDVS